MIEEIIQKIKSGTHLSVEETQHSIHAMLKGDVTEGAIVKFLDALIEKGESSSEVLGGVNALREHCVKVHLEGDVIDVCGTGGSGKDRFNISTCAAFILAAGGVGVAKHGNYGSQRHNGSFNFLEALDISFDHTSDQIEAIFRETNLCFIFARRYHPAMKHVAMARKQLGKRSIFNVLGPLANPAKVRFQIIGLPNKDHVDLLMAVIQQLPIQRAMLLVGGDGRDELSLEGDNLIIDISQDQVTKTTFSFQTEIESCPADYPCGDSNENAALFKTLLSEKKWNHPIIKHCCINAAAGFMVMGKVTGLKEGYELAMALFEEKKVSEKIESYRRIAMSIMEE